MHWCDFLNTIGVHLTVLPVRHDQALGTTEREQRLYFVHLYD
jgi:hypothetical protein